MSTRRKILAGMGTVALGGLLWNRFPGEADQAVAASQVDDRASYFPNVWLQNQDGEKVRFYDDLVRGKIVAINFMYVLCEGVCPTMTSNLRKVQQLLGERVGEEVFMYSITLQPEIDTPQTLKAYADKHRIQPGWQFLTGTPADIKRLRYGLGFYDPDELVDNTLETHTGMVRIGNDRTERWTMAPALAEPERIIATINHVDTAMVHTAYRGNGATGRVG